MLILRISKSYILENLVFPSKKAVNKIIIVKSSNRPVNIKKEQNHFVVEVFCIKLLKVVQSKFLKELLL